VRLILADWLSINQTLDEMKQDAIVKESEHRSKCADIIYNGRDMNVCLIADLQSYNLAALGLKADRNSRKNFNLIALGNYYIEEDGSINESYGVVENMILDRNIIPDESERARLIDIFRQLKPLSKEHQRPIMFTTLEPARVVLLPDLRVYKAGELPRMKLEGYTPEQLERLFQLEFEIDAPLSPKDQPEKGDEQPSISREKLNEYGDYLVSKIDGKDWVLISKLGGVAWKTRDWGDDVLNRVIQDLINRELVEVDTKDGVKRIRRIR
jgi:hypothetical protein